MLLWYLNAGFNPAFLSGRCRINLYFAAIYDIIHV